MTEADREMLSAFVDGEPVEAAALAEAVASDGGRQELLDLMLMRAWATLEIAGETEGDLDRLDRRVLGALASAEASRPRSRLALVAAAAILVIAIGLGAVLRLRWSSANGDAAADAPPPPTRQLTFTEGQDWFRS